MEKNKEIQPGPKYPNMAISIHPELHQSLRNKYSENNICWPILAYDINSLTVKYILIEVNSKNHVNSSQNESFLGPSPFPEYKLDYTKSPRDQTPIPLGHNRPWSGPKNILSLNYQSSYEFVTTEGGLNTIDIDYVWRTPEGTLYALETSTFYNYMSTEGYAKHLVKRFIEERASRKRAHHFRILAEVASSIGIQMSLVFFNVVGHSNKIRTDGYIYSIPLNIINAKKMHKGIFVEGEYLKFSTWLDSL